MVITLLLAVGAAGIMDRDALLAILFGRMPQAPAIVSLQTSTDVPVLAPSPGAMAPSIIAPTPVKQQWQVAVERLNLRTGPGADYPVLTILSRGDKVEYLGKTAGSGADVWIRVRAGTQEGWVFRAFLQEPTSPSP